MELGLPPTRAKGNRHLPFCLQSIINKVSIDTDCDHLLLHAATQNICQKSVRGCCHNIFCCLLAAAVAAADEGFPCSYFWYIHFNANHVKIVIFAACYLFYFCQAALKKGQMPFVYAIADAPHDICSKKWYHWLLLQFMDNTVKPFSVFGSKLHETACCCAIPHSSGRDLDAVMRCSQSSSM